jgi:hypothetical protein
MKIVLFLMLGLLSLGIVSFAVNVPDAKVAILLDLLAVLLSFLALGTAQDYWTSKTKSQFLGASPHQNFKPKASNRMSAKR